MKKNIIRMMYGIPASGKTSYCKDLIDKQPNKWKRISKDDLRAMFDNSHWSKENEKFINRVEEILIEEAINDGYSVLWDNTSLAPKHLERLKQLSKKLRVEYEIKDFTDVPVNECIRRDLNRPNSVGRKVILGMYFKYLAKPFKIKEWKDELPTAIQCDIDGTIAIKGDRDIYDESKVYLDTVNEPVLSVLKNLPKETTIIFCSGRSEDCREQTTKWLEDKVIPHLKVTNWFLIMRKSGDKRADEIVKTELYREYVEGKYNLEFILDDRPKVVRAWRELGLFVMSVAQSEEEF